mmetsp:Transcript_14385/g.29781  ORF Transcript_14385/g.29781 Transcript_14385/m.29781 type:complete len:83 (+) Transcript_14385:195-443(+)
MEIVMSGERLVYICILLLDIQSQQRAQLDRCKNTHLRAHSSSKHPSTISSITVGSNAPKIELCLLFAPPGKEALKFELKGLC